MFIYVGVSYLPRLLELVYDMEVFYSSISQSETITLNGALQKGFNSDGHQKER